MMASTGDDADVAETDVAEKAAQRLRGLQDTLSNVRQSNEQLEEENTRLRSTLEQMHIALGEQTPARRMVPQDLSSFTRMVSHAGVTLDANGRLPAPPEPPRRSSILQALDQQEAQRDQARQQQPQLGPLQMISLVRPLDKLQLRSLLPEEIFKYMRKIMHWNQANGDGFALSMGISPTLRTELIAMASYHLVNRNLRLPTLDDFDLDQERVKSMLLYCMAPRTQEQFIQLLFTLATFPGGNRYSYKGHLLEDMNQFILSYVEFAANTTEVYDMLAHENVANVPPASTSKGGIIYVFLQKIPFQFRSIILKHFFPKRYKSAEVHAFQRDFLEYVNAFTISVTSDLRAVVDSIVPLVTYLKLDTPHDEPPDATRTILPRPSASTSLPPTPSSPARLPRVQFNLESARPSPAPSLHSLEELVQTAVRQSLSQLLGTRSEGSQEEETPSSTKYGHLAHFPEQAQQRPSDTDYGASDNFQARELADWSTSHALLDSLSFDPAREEVAEAMTDMEQLAAKQDSMYQAAMYAFQQQPYGKTAPPFPKLPDSQRPCRFRLKNQPCTEPNCRFAHDEGTIRRAKARIAEYLAKRSKR